MCFSPYVIVSVGLGLWASLVRDTRRDSDFDVVAHRHATSSTRVEAKWLRSAILRPQYTVGNPLIQRWQVDNVFVFLMEAS